MENMKIIKCVPSKLLVVHWYICYIYVILLILECGEQIARLWTADI